MVTGTRAEYGLLRLLMREIQQSKVLELQLVVTGMHLSPEYGLTYQEIESDGFTIDCKVEMLLSSDTGVAIAKATGLGVIGFADAIEQLNPDVLLVLGDRYEIFAAVTAALFAKLPVAHLHGGETTEGAYDEGIRHAITKMSHLHFVASEEYRNRVIQLGENPSDVVNVGGLGVDAILKTQLLTRKELSEQLQIGPRYLLITYHPETLSSTSTKSQMEELFSALMMLERNISFLFTYPNADSNGRVIHRMLDDFVSENSTRAFVHQSLGQTRYWSAMKHADAVVGNSSSGLLEAPTLGTPTVNIGNRQKGRLLATSVIDAKCNAIDIQQAIGVALSNDFVAIANKAVNPLGTGGASEAIVRQLSSRSLDVTIVQKRFFKLGPICDQM